MQISHRPIRALAGLLIALAATAGNADTDQTPPIGKGQPPQFPPSNTVLQAALTEVNRCIDDAIVTSANTETATTADAVLGKCATAQGRLKQMLPPGAYDAGTADTRQRVSKALATQKEALAIQKEMDSTP